MKFLALGLLLLNGCASGMVTREHEWGQVKAAFLYGLDVGLNQCADKPKGKSP